MGLKKRRESDNLIRDYISTIDELTTQIFIKQDKISNLNAKVREMIRNQFNNSDYLYTRYYEQIDDSRKAERVYRIVRKQLKEFTNTKNLQHIDELLDDAFDGIMSKLSKTELEFKEKDMLLIRFALAGFSAKSIAALLEESHQNINQRKKRMLDKIQIKAPKLMEELRIALNHKQIDSAPELNH
jgi:DNA-binding NarL/FixJ family response regulator